MESVDLVPDSSLIQRIRWDRNPDDHTVGTIQIQFKLKSDIYSYHRVPATIFESMLVADSIGKFFCENIRDTYTFIKEETWENI
jgi:hypothetical protein